jgi:hypothetical protein
VLASGRTTRAGGAILVLAYAGLVLAFLYTGNR